MDTNHPVAGLPDPASIQCKGFTLKGALSFVEATYGADARARVLAAASPETREVLGGTVLASALYPFRAQVDLYLAIDKALGRGDLALCRLIGRFTAEHELSTIHKITLKVASLSLWMRSAGRMWNQYYTAGTLVADEFGATGGRLRVERFNPISKAFCLDLLGWFERTAELSGKSGVAVEHPRCLLDGHGACLFEARWKP